MKRRSLHIGEIVAFIGDGELQFRSVRKIRRLIDDEATTYDASFDRFHGFILRGRDSLHNSPQKP